MPAYSEMLPLLGVRSKSVVHFWMRKLLKEGILEKDRKGLLRPVRRDFALPLVGAIQAGFPTPSEEELRDLVSLDEYLVTKPEASFLLRVSGDSMTGEGIMPGDLVIVERGREPRAGDVVVAQVDGEWTMKYFTRTKSGAVVLESANPKYPPIRAREELKIAGIVLRWSGNIIVKSSGPPFISDSPCEKGVEGEKTDRVEGVEGKVKDFRELDNMTVGRRFSG